ncbi:AAA family ATPase [Streptomyces sp. NPDC029674]|uniref:helix-turn-helix transcriptional regulator n=1 Tax=Streptomyces sp. NPDC029674 TaxID=3365297 RepID=UPI00384E7583
MGRDVSPLVGRDAQLAVIDAALADIGSTGTSVILRGDPGTGRTALLGSAEATARRAGLRVLRMTGAEAEAGLPFAALHQILWPLLDDARGLTDEQRHALESALGIREGTPPEGFTVASAALTLLAHAAARRPVVVLLDDLQWADPSSVAVFGYVQRHLAPLPVVAIAATRRAGDTAGRAPAAVREKRDANEGLPGQVIDLPPLDASQAERLLRTTHPALPDGARRRVLRAAAGNPLALHELPRQLRRVAADRAESYAGPAPLGLTDPFDALPLGERLGRLYEDRLRALPDAVRRLLLVAALDDASARCGTVLRAMADRDPGTAWTRLKEHIESSGLAHTDPDSDVVVFHHPLVRACLVHIASPAERRAAHRLLADALPAKSPRRALHLAAAALGTDGELAALLHAEADSMAAQGGDVEAAELMARAARLSPDPASRTARLVAAAAAAVRSGRPHLAAELVAEAETEARPGKPEPAAPYAFAVAYTRLQLGADPHPSIELLPAVLGTPVLETPVLETPVLDEPDGGDPQAALREPMLFLLLVAAALTGDERAWAAVERHAAHASPAATLCRDAWAGAVHEVPRRLRETVATLPADRETTAAWFLLWAAAAVDAVGEHDALWSAFARHHAYATQTFIDSLRARDDFLHGHWDASLTASRAGARTSADHGYALAETLFLQNTAQILAARGDRAGLAELEPALRARARARGLRLVTERLRGAKVLCALGHGLTEEAWHHARGLMPPDEGEELPSGSPWLHLSLVDRVQAAVDSGRRAEARHHLRAVRSSGLARASAHHTFLMAVAEAFAAEEDEAEERYEAVYALPGAESWPFPLARAHLAHAAWLRRHGRPERAVVHSRAALTVFTRLGATPWAAQASRELAAATADAGTAAGPAGGHRHSSLSAQETRIAELAAEGLTNRQIGERLGLSPRTIGAHLYRVFPKLGITTRAGIARALADGPGTGRD